MTVTPDLLEELVEGQTYLLGTSWEHPDGSGGVRWQLQRYQQPGPEALRVPGMDGAMWCPVETRLTAKPPNGHYREVVPGCLMAMGYDLRSMDIILILPDGNERLRPAAMEG
jgi:hypothetical protein